ncbi:hypothetical protein HMPREF3038_02971 [Akkermansia sp. KLE1797]|nr:hypothetical protein HMPREF3038_02971 [Akkermansia sp. KLE1797]KZA03992.1 hypothetical protein HMPREF1326_02187 [Akkermansia sp. KLE1605]
MYDVPPRLLPPPAMILCGYPMERHGSTPLFRRHAVTPTPERQKAPFAPSTGLHSFYPAP